MNGAPKVIVVMPALNAAATLRETFLSIPRHAYSHVILVDDGSTDGTVELARALGIETLIEHGRRRGYGANQKTCYREALRQGADIVAMIHPDNQYDARLLPAFIEFARRGTCDIVLGNRIRSRRDALAGGMPLWKYAANRLLTIIANVTLGTNVGDFHSGLRVYTRKALEQVDWAHHGDDFSFDPQFLAQAAYLDLRIGDAPIPCKYFPEASSINLPRSIVYGFQTLHALLMYALAKCGLRLGAYRRLR